MIVNPQIALDHGLKKEEYKKICELLKRTPNITELGIFSAMWNEHCSYKSSRKHLKKMHTKGKQVIQGPGENAGVIDIGDDDAIVFKIESHNHPSFIEPYQGAATGVGGIMRDVFTMGARPIANLNSIHFGSPQHKKTRNLLRGVEIGIGMQAAEIEGIENADEIFLEKDKISFTSNNAGGVLGGITSGQDIITRFAVKPTSSILSDRKSISKMGSATMVSTKGRHDPCVGIRAVPVGEAMVACVILDHFLLHRGQVGQRSGKIG